MIVRNYPSFEEAIWSLTKNHQGYLIYKHEFPVGENVDYHYHKKAWEWIIINQGQVIVGLEDKEVSFNLNGKTIAIYLPKGKKHALRPLSAVRYWVLRNRPDRSIYVKKGGK